MGDVFVGSCSWADQTLVKDGHFYPSGVRTPEQRLRYYAERFSIVEIDSTYYRLPGEENAIAWDERTPPNFRFDAKAFRLLTTHPAQPSALPPDIRAALPPRTVEKRSVYLKDLPADAQREMWRRFGLGLRPLHAAGKLRAVLLQFPQWFFPSHESRAYILSARKELAGYQVAVEFRHGSWVNDKNRERTLAFLRDNQLTFVCVDEPQAVNGTLPPLALVTNPELAMVRFHGRDPEAWTTRASSAAERFRYLYSDAELREWVPRVQEMASQARETHVLMNNCYRDNAIVNGQQIRQLLAAN
ncbi:MAG: DUF72 domain-containing protein [Chloroflexota bacterium]